MVKRKKYRAWKTVGFWVLGAVFASIGSLVASNINLGQWVGFKSFITFLIAMFFFLIAGLFWIAISVAVKEAE
jgi:hypothetical protein